eukprot:TRINITY_DN24522_c0_g1_i1.p1 TRINITY_DN24522_c0_g1~~TRINITY_DN24522_c0_g1_i1.p1  ORF type:complete len:325 (+),score=67.11 TRINITY_DN24522_c0_g1_i1:56-1030(+)
MGGAAAKPSRQKVLQAQTIVAPRLGGVVPGAGPRRFVSAAGPRMQQAAMSGPGAQGAAAAALDKIGGALWGLYIGDAMAMPTHWYYGGARQVQSDYGGPIRGYTKPKTELAGSIMNKSSTGGGGRGSDQGSIIGQVINHGKAQYWTARGAYHYHCTLNKGENTLEAQLVRLVCRSITECQGRFTPDDMRNRYMQFMTTPGSHNDCYASTCHRMFFANLKKGTRPEDCPDNDNHNVDTIDGLIMAIPVMLAGFRHPIQEVQRAAAVATTVTRKSQELQRYSGQLTALLTDVVLGASLRDALKSKAGRGLEQVIMSASSKPDPVVA